MPLEDNEKAEKQHEEKEKTLVNAGLAGAAAKVIQDYGSENKEYLVAYSGVDNETEQKLSKSLKGESKIYYEQDKKITETIKDPQQAAKLKHQNLKSRAGFAAEIDEVAKENAKRIRSNDPTRRIRTDDLTGDLKGTVDRELYDHVDLDKNGNPIPGSESQMKMKGESADEALDKLMSRGEKGKNEKYLDNDVRLKVQKDFADEIIKKADERIKGLEAEKKALLGVEGKEEALQKKQRQIEKLEKCKELVGSAHDTNQESKDSVINPKWTTAKRIIKTSHDAGLEQAKNGAVIGGSVSIIKNVVALAKGEKDAGEAIVDVAKDTGSAVAVSYGTAFAGSALKGAMQNAPSKTIQALSKSNLPAMLVTVTLETGKTLGKYFKGEIDGVQCLEELGEKGTGMVSSAIGSTLGAAGAAAIFGTAAIIGPITIPVIGGLIGGMVGYALSSACYGQLVSSLKDAKLARERRIQIEAECAEAIRMIREYRAEMEAAISEYLSDHIAVFHTAFDEIKTAHNIGDIDGFISGANKIIRKLGGKPQYENMSEFEALMESSESLIL